MFKNMDKINEEFNEQWVFLINCEKNSDGAVIGGNLAVHNKRNEKIYYGR